jgi:hypothetical protein
MSHTAANQSSALARWQSMPKLLMIVGAVLSLLGLARSPEQFGYSWLLAFMFFLSLGLGALFLVIVHHLFDASWSVPIRRFCEHMATLLFPWMLLLFLPLVPMVRLVFPWMNLDPHADHALHAKLPLFTIPMFFVVSGLCFLVWWFLSNRLLYWSLRQDQTGEAIPTYRMRFYSGIGIILFAVTLTLGVVLWMKSLQHQWFSTMYAVYYFAGSVWMTLATVYVITMVLDRLGLLSEVIHEQQYYFIGSLLFAFTVFYAYIHFSQYFIIWNGNIPEETFWYVVREKGTWWWVGMVIIFGHFFIPFLALLRIDVKSVFPYMSAIAVWAWLMHWVDLSFNILPVVNPEGFPLKWLWLHIGCWAFMAGLLSTVFLKKLARHPLYPIKDPRLSESMGLYHGLPSGISVAPGRTEDLPPHFGGTHR